MMLTEYSLRADGVQVYDYRKKEGQDGASCCCLWPWRKRKTMPLLTEEALGQKECALFERCAWARSLCSGEEGVCSEAVRLRYVVFVRSFLEVREQEEIESTGESWNQLEQWVKDRYPCIPIYAVHDRCEQEREGDLRLFDHQYQRVVSWARAQAFVWSWLRELQGEALGGLENQAASPRFFARAAGGRGPLV